jgi:phenylalanyl-tRNA synthetase alpha chain
MERDMAEPEQAQAVDLKALRAEFDRALAEAQDLVALQALHDRFLGRKSGRLTALMKQLGALSPEERRSVGQSLNTLKGELEAALALRREALERDREGALLARERVDLSLPARRAPLGRRHPLTVVREELEDIFVSLGYEVYDGPEVEDDYHCFEALNMPPDHPARDMQDTFYLEAGGLLLRTHTSSGQIRYMLSNPHPPHVRIICPGKVFRRDPPDPTHLPMFQQIEALVVGPGITLGDLKGTIEAFLHALFGPQYPVRFRPSYFPYTEPSVEADLGCIVCGGSGKNRGEPCRLCKTTGWIEIMGSGLVHPAVFEAVNTRLGRKLYDPEQVSGFAFGLGIERVALIRHGIEDMRQLYENDLRFLEQFAE